LFDQLAAEKLCDIPTVLSEEEVDVSLEAGPPTIVQPAPVAPSNDFDFESFLVPSPAVNAQLSSYFADTSMTDPSVAGLEPSLQAMCCAPADTLNYFGGDFGMMDGVLNFGYYPTSFDEAHGSSSGFSPWQGFGGQTL
jgi:hypothetical protein